MNIFNDIKSPLLLRLKGGLFALLAVMTAVMIVLTDNRWYKIGLLVLCIWAACRFYYFFFYVLDHYVGGDKNASLFAMTLRLFRQRKNAQSATSSVSDTSIYPSRFEIPEAVCGSPATKGSCARPKAMSPGRQVPAHPDSGTTNLFAELPKNLSEELIETIAVSKHVRIERIVSTGQSSPTGFWYDQDEHEWVVVLRGSAVLEFEGHSLQLLPGDYVLIPPRQKHRVASTSANEPTVWLAVFFQENAKS